MPAFAPSGSTAEAGDAEPEDGYPLLTREALAAHEYYHRKSTSSRPPRARGCKMFAGILLLGSAVLWISWPAVKPRFLRESKLELISKPVAICLSFGAEAIEGNGRLWCVGCWLCSSCHWCQRPVCKQTEAECCSFSCPAGCSPLGCNKLGYSADTCCQSDDVDVEDGSHLSAPAAPGSESFATLLDAPNVTANVSLPAVVASLPELVAELAVLAVDVENAIVDVNTRAPATSATADASASVAAPSVTAEALDLSQAALE